MEMEPSELGEQGKGEEQILEQIFFEVAHGSSSPVRAVGGESILGPCVHPCACCSTAQPGHVEG